LPDDDLALGAHWALYPEIGRRLGVDGPEVFRTRHGTLDIAGAVKRYYTLYASSPPASWPPSVNRARKFIREEVRGQKSSDLDRPVSEDDVQQAYLQILGRDADPAAVANCVTRGITAAQLRVILLRSPEFKARLQALEAAG
jgi:hypothetical protein